MWLSLMFTGYRAPRYPVRKGRSTIQLPHLLRSLEAPMKAMDLGLNKWSSCSTRLLVATEAPF